MYSYFILKKEGKTVAKNELKQLVKHKYMYNIHVHVHVHTYYKSAKRMPLVEN